MVKLTSILNWNGYHNLPKKYIYRRMFKGVVYENNHYMTPTVVYNYTKDWIFDENAPWTTAAEQLNDPTNPNRTKLIKIIPPLKEWFFFRGDRVQILVGKDSGKQGIINGIVKQRNWVFVEGLNCKLVGINMGKTVSDVTFQQKEMPLVVNRDVKLVDPSDLKPCDVSFRFTDQGESVRVSKRTGQIIPVPADAEATVDYVSKSAYKHKSPIEFKYKAGEKDTTPNEIQKETFIPKYKTFEQDLMDEYEIKEDKERAPTYIY